MIRSFSNYCSKLRDDVGLMLCNLLYRHECFIGKYTTRKIHTQPHPGLEGRIFHILTSEDVDAFADIKFVP